MWQAIQYVTSIATLLAFLIAVGAYIWRSVLKHRVKVIQGADTPEKKNLILAMSGQIDVDIKELPIEQRTKLVETELERRHQRALEREWTIRRTFIFVFLAFVLVAIISTFSGAGTSNAPRAVTMTVFGARDYLHRPGAPMTAVQQQINNEIKGMLPRQPDGALAERQRVIVLTLNDKTTFRQEHGPFSLGLAADEVEKVPDAKGRVVVLEKPAEQFTAKVLRADGQTDPIDAIRAETQTGRKYLRFDIPGVGVGDDLLIMIRRHEHAEPFFRDDETVTLRDVRDLK